MIEFLHTSKVYPNGVEAVRDLTFTIKQGEEVFITGPAGAGKTTIFKLLIKDESPTGGTIMFGGASLNSLPDKEIPYIRRKFGVVFQDLKLLPDRTVEDNISFVLHAIGISYSQRKEKITRILSLFGFENKYSLLPKELSAGEKQKLAFARALSTEPEVLLIDEPFSHLEVASAWELLQLFCFDSLHKRTVVVITQDREIARKSGRRVIELKAGQIITNV
ncbi:MAG: ATP-binding cassette domain-containing protein [Candidatus Firestonebacteria bacterium]